MQRVLPPIGRRHKMSHCLNVDGNKSRRLYLGLDHPRTLHGELIDAHTHTMEELSYHGTAHYFQENMSVEACYKNQTGLGLSSTPTSHW